MVRNSLRVNIHSCDDSTLEISVRRSVSFIVLSGDATSHGEEEHPSTPSHLSTTPV